MKVSQSYTNENGGKVGGDIVENIAGNIVDVPSSSPDEEKDASTDAKDVISSSKVATLDEKVASSEPKDVTSEEKVASPKEENLVRRNGHLHSGILRYVALNG